MAEYFPFYESFKQAADMLPDAERLQLYDMITDYGCLGIEPESGNSIVLAMFVLIRPSIDSAKRSQNSGAKGGRGNRKAETNESETNISGSENPPLHNCKPPLGEIGKHKGNSKGDSNSNSESNGFTATCGRKQQDVSLVGGTHCELHGVQCLNAESAFYI